MGTVQTLWYACFPLTRLIIFAQTLTVNLAPFIVAMTIKYRDEFVGLQPENFAL